MSPHGVFQLPKVRRQFVGRRPTAIAAAAPPAPSCQIILTGMPAVLASRHNAPPHLLAPEHRQRSRHRSPRPIADPTRARAPICAATFAFSGSPLRQPVPRLDQRRQRLIEPRQITVIRRRNQRVQREVLLRAQHPHRMQPARDSPSRLHIHRKIFLLRTALARADHGQLFELYSHPLFGFSKCGGSSTDSKPFQSVAGSLPSTGFVQSNFVSRRGMKFP